VRKLVYRPTPARATGLTSRSCTLLRISMSWPGMPGSSLDGA
jgi:hypothetical protein